MSTRLRQVVLAAESLAPVADELKTELGLDEGYHDPGVGAFGLENVVYAVGDCFLEVIAPVRDGTTAGRLLSRDGPGGYMAIFQTDDLVSVRRRVSELGIRVVWETELEDIAAMHLHPKDIQGAIVSVDQPDPPASWRWAGPSWIGENIVAKPGGVRGITVRVDDPASTAERWASVLGEHAISEDGGSTISLDGGRQCVRFVERDGGRPGVAAIDLDLDGVAARTLNIGGAEFTLSA